MPQNDQLKIEIQQNVAKALAEDLGTGDLTALLIDENVDARGQVIAGQDAVLCGTQWFDATFLMLDPECTTIWHAKDGDTIRAGQVLCEIFANARALLTAERCALNFLQILSGTATTTRHFVEAVKGTGTKVVDTRRTLPGLRLAQKYAVRMGGGLNQRLGLYDGVLIKENHILSAGGVKNVLKQVRQMMPSNALIEIEVETLDELREAIENNAKFILLNNMTREVIIEAVAIAAGRGVQLGTSGGLSVESAREVALLGLDRIAVSALTKDVSAIDFGLRHIEKRA